MSGKPDKKPSPKVAAANRRLFKTLEVQINEGRYPWGALTLRLDSSRIFRVKWESEHRVDGDGEMEWTPPDEPNGKGPKK